MIAIQPTRLGLQDKASAAATFEFLTAQVESGLRASLASSGILTGSLKIELIERRRRDANHRTQKLGRFPNFTRQKVKFQILQLRLRVC